MDAETQQVVDAIRDPEMKELAQNTMTVLCRFQGQYVERMKRLEDLEQENDKLKQHVILLQTQVENYERLDRSMSELCTTLQKRVDTQDTIISQLQERLTAMKSKLEKHLTV